MCGIAGFVGRGNDQDLKRMITAIKYRGPDDQGIFLQQGVGLAYVRLSILDLSPAGHQPMSSADGSIHLVFNGEIYNFMEWRQTLLATGKYEFKGHSDTEVIIYLYQEYGEEVFSKLNGMFALALYDFKQQKLILARDRLGKKPLYWAKFNNTMMFASELKALLQHPGAQKNLSFSALNKYLLYEYVPTPATIFTDIFKLEPASYLVWQNNSVRKKVFWQMDFTTQPIDFPSALAELDSLISDSVATRLVADVPVGIFLSGGIDSSAVAYYAQAASQQKIKTFSIGFTEKSFDESVYAQEVATFLNTDHYHQVLTAQDSLNLIPKIAELIDEPLADASVVPTYLLSGFTRAKVTVALGGDGGDELFAGYPTFQAQKFVRWYLKIPAVVRNKFIEKFISALPASEKNFSWDFKLRKFLSAINEDPRYRQQNWLGSFNHQQRQKLFLNQHWGRLSGYNEHEDLDRYLAEVAGASFDNQMLYLYLRTYLMDQVLVKVDRASMLNSLEVRAPLLDYRLVDFVNSLPYNYKLRGLTTKYVFKKLMVGKLPAAIINRSKKGFGIPLARWLKNELKDWCDYTLSAEKIKQGGILDFSYINQLKQNHFSGKSDNHKQLWTLLVWQLWQERWL